MKYIAITLYFIVFLLLFFTYTKATIKKGALAKMVSIIMGLAMIVTLMYLILLTSKLFLVSSIAYVVYFMLMDWLCYALLQYAFVFAQEKRRYPGVRKLLITAIIIDNVSLALNVIFQHVVGFSVMEWGDGIWLVLEKKPLFSLHMLICYAMIIFYFLILIRAAIKSPKLYQTKYIYVIMGLFIATVVNAIFVFTNLVIDVSILTYGLAAIVFFFYTFEYLPKNLAVRASSIMVQHYSDAILVYDMSGNCINENDAAVGLFGSQLTKGDIAEFCTKKKLCREEELEKDFTCERLLKVREKELVVRIEYGILADERGHKIGAYLFFHDMANEVEVRQREWYLMTHDRLTGLYNREYFYEMTQKMLEQNPNEKYVMFCSNVGQFKLVNEFFDVEVGNNILKKIADIMKSSAVRGSVYGRLDSDRFAVCMRWNDYSEERLLHNNGRIELGDIHNFSFVNYFGVYIIEDNDMSVSSMCDLAMMAIDTIKGDYNRNVAYYNKEIHDEFVEEQSIINDFASALKDEEFKIYIQPQISLKTGLCESGEVLVRWNHKGEGIISPAKFIPAFEKNGMIAQLDRYVWEKACMLLQKWEQEDKNNISLSVNISPKDFYYMDIDKELYELIRKYNVDPKRLNLEITESAFVHEQEQMLELIARLQALGFSIEMDDFGCGYSSLNTLKDIPVDVLKIDMEFLGDSENKERSNKIVEMVILLGKALGLIVIAEGVETEENVRFLKEIGCDIVQGYFFARPIDIPTFESVYFR